MHLMIASFGAVAIAIPVVMCLLIALSVRFGTKLMMRAVGAPDIPSPSSRRRAQARLEQVGVVGQAVLVSFQELGQQNFEPLVELTLSVTPADGGEPFETSLSQQIAFSVIGKLAPGLTVSVRYDPADHANVELVGDFGAPADGATDVDLDTASAGDIASAVRAAGGNGRPADSVAGLLQSGQKMVATVTEFSPSGRTVGDIDPTKPDPGDPMYVFKVELPISAAHPIDSTFEHRVPVAKVPTVALGVQLAVAVDPANPTRNVAIDWSRSLAT